MYLKIFVKEFPGQIRKTILITQNTPRLKQIALQAMMIYQKFGLYSARKQLRNPEMGLLDLKNSGLHVIAVTDDGILILDNSGQGKAGMDISGILDLKGKSLFSLFQNAASGNNNGFVKLKGVWPHPSSHETGIMSAWCGKLSTNSRNNRFKPFATRPSRLLELFLMILSLAFSLFVRRFFICSK
jgi:hypothetical protein